MPEINYATEGELDAIVAARIIEFCGGIPGLKRVAGGKSKLDPVIAKYVQSSHHLPWLIIRDLDRDEICAPLLARRLSAETPQFLCLRIAVRQIESWLLADRAAMSHFLKVPLARLPNDPESILDAKRAVVDLAANSKSKDIRLAMVPSVSSGASEGPEFSAFMTDFVIKHWRPEIASALIPNSSLDRAIRCLRSLVNRLEN
ncbi:hypothetical protein [Caulobacter sp.]|uniref:hypothetical protein n=1 Tax=Caulobacter sp. TaxID=78 RepID=UPI003BAA155C